MTLALMFAFGIGVMAGLRSLTAPAVVAWAAHWGWLDLSNSYLAFLESAAARYVLSVLAVCELLADKVPSAPNRTAPLGLGTRILTGAVSGMAVVYTANLSLIVGGVLGALGGLTGAFAGYEARRRLVQKLRIPDPVIAVAEDVLAIAGSLILLYRG
jgi:uncharacterized membrane protein